MAKLLTHDPPHPFFVNGEGILHYCLSNFIFHLSSIAYYAIG